MTDGVRGISPCSHVKRAATHTPVHGATVCAGLVRDALLALHRVPEGAVRVG